MTRIRTFLLVGGLVAIATTVIAALIILIIAGGYVVAGWVAPIEWPPALVTAMGTQGGVVVLYIGALAGITAGFIAVACRDQW